MAFLTQWIISFGYLALFGAVLLESGVFFGFFLPGDTLLFTAGLFAAKGSLNIVLVCLLCFLGATIGVQLGYWFGAKVGRRLYAQARKDSFWLRSEHLEQTKKFYEHHGKKTIILARFTPVVRTFAPIVAGIAEMDYQTFVLYNIFGAIIWAIGIPLLGYFAGNLIPNIDHYILPIIVVIIIASAIPGLLHFRHRKWRNYWK